MSHTTNTTKTNPKTNPSSCQTYHCPKCQSNHCVKNGILRNQQRYHCKNCKLNFTQTTNPNYTHPHTKPTEVKKLAITLYLKGNGLRDIREVIQDTFNILVSATTIGKWIKKRA